MGENQEHNTNEGDYDKDWRSRFHHQWPNMTTLMHQSEITIHPFSSQTTKIPEWDSNGQNSWSGIEIKPVERESSEEISSIPTVVKERGCEKKCRIVLCVFLILSIAIAGAAGIGLSIILTKDPNDLSRHHHIHHDHDLQVEANLTAQQSTYLTNTFCKLVKKLLAKADFPTESGLQECVTRLFLVPGSDDLRIDMHVTPREGFTIKEKFMRALHESYILEKTGTLRPDIKTTITPATPTLVRSDTTPETHDLLLLPSSTTASFPIENAGATTTLKSSETALGGGVITTIFYQDGTGDITMPVLKHSEEQKRTTVMTHSTESRNAILESSETVQSVGAMNMLPDQGNITIPVLKQTEEPATVMTTVTVSTVSHNAILKSSKTVQGDGAMTTLPDKGRKGDITVPVLKQNVEPTTGMTMLPLSSESLHAILESSETGRFDGTMTTLPDKDGKGDITVPVLKHSVEPTTGMTTEPVSTVSRNAILESSETVQGFGAMTTLPDKGEKSDNTSPVSKLDAERTTGMTSTSLPPIQVAHDIYSQSNTIPNEVTTIKRNKVTETADVSTQSSKITSTLTVRADTQESELLNAVPVAIQLFNPEFSTFGSDASKIANAPPKPITRQSSKIVESLMVGGVMKLPIRTDSNFRFLFSSDSKSNKVSRPNTQYESSSQNEAKQIDKHGNSVNSVNTEKPPAPELFRTLRRPVSSTKSFVQENFKLTNQPKRRIHMSEFADPRVIFSRTIGRQTGSNMVK